MRPQKLKSQVNSNVDNAMKLLLCLAVATIASSCASTKTCEKYVILDYEDFGPQAMAHSLIGMQWWQWQDHGSPNAGTLYDIKVIVHPDSLTKDVKKDFPIAPIQHLDYRYVTFKNAQSYLDHHIAEDLIPTLTAELKLTREKIDKVAICNR